MPYAFPKIALIKVKPTVNIMKMRKLKEWCIHYLHAHLESGSNIWPPPCTEVLPNSPLGFHNQISPLWVFLGFNFCVTLPHKFQYHLGWCRRNHRKWKDRQRHSMKERKCLSCSVTSQDTRHVSEREFCVQTLSFSVCLLFCFSLPHTYMRTHTHTQPPEVE